MKQGAYLIHQEGDVIIRAIRDYLRPDTEEIIIDDGKSFEKAKQYIGKFVLTTPTNCVTTTNHCLCLAAIKSSNRLKKPTNVKYAYHQVAHCY